ncbi:DUF4222 domain-containing protein [Buttiauxella sp. 3AFRM03]|uniref:DUF4222 domain-containing protein n=1 Tax=Buttiauxella sp. 3AFRM03 TaxID=2479367 RepID=UPI000EF8088D|nr:DUF4222 domain-containing protein [Buttiauxella sp. 3AFRM03]AYN28645.1 DUF4222 domain-containing protein [Buttiauxella sp. 3AFRM03]
MKKKLNQAQPEGVAQSEIRPGDKWKDSHGTKITITHCTPNRVAYIREGYTHPCFCSPDRLRREFTCAKPNTLTEWATTTSPREMAKNLRTLINALRASK